MVAPNNPNELTSTEYVAYSAGFYDGVIQQSTETLDLLEKMLREIDNPQIIKTTLQEIHDKIQSGCFLCHSTAENIWKDGQQSRPVCGKCINKLKNGCSY